MPNRIEPAISSQSGCVLTSSLMQANLHAMSNTSPSLDQLKRAIEIAEQIQSLEVELQSVLGGNLSVGSAPTPPPFTSALTAKTPKAGTKGKRVVSPATRAKMAAAQQARHAKKKNGASALAIDATPKSKSAKRVLSPEGRARIVAALKARHAANRRLKA
jgi:hypothetical protein